MPPLNDLIVLDVGNLTAGPLTSWLLGSLGADVIKIESPGGDHGRTIFTESEKDDSVGGYYYHSTNTDKRSAVLDLKTDDGREALLDLVEEADVLVENFRPGTMASLGLDYGTLSERNDSLIYCSITGYGQDNLGVEKRAYDSILQALSGIMTATGYSEDPPTKVGASMVDNLGSYLASLAVLGALRYRERTGKGQSIDVSMQDCVAWVTQMLLPFGPKRTVHQPSRGPLPLNGVFSANDGWISVAAPDSAAVDRLSEMLPKIDVDSETSDPAHLEDRIAAWVAERSTEEIAEGFEQLEVFVAPVQQVEDVIEDPHLESRGAFEAIDCQGESVTIPVSPYRTAIDSVGRPSNGGPSLGEHTDEVLSELAGYDDDRIESLRSEDE